jgi:hypothetical protein
VIGRVHLNNFSGKRLYGTEHRARNGDRENLGDGPPVSHHDKANGVLVGPAGPPAGSSPEDDVQSALSPYSANRAAIRNLTVPKMPMLDIPPSPPGSPPPGMEKKFQHFLELKKQGVHFNEKLASSSALKNPSLLKKLMDYAGLDEQDQYSTTLPEDVWNPKGFPPWAFKEELARSQQEVTKKKEEERAKTRRESIEFVSANNSGQSSKEATPRASTGAKSLRGSAADRVMAGLDRGETSSPLAGTGSTRDDRTGSYHKARSGAFPPSPKRRKRSRSR